MKMTRLRWNDERGIQLGAVTIGAGSAYVGFLVDLLLGHGIDSIEITHHEWPKRKTTEAPDA